MQYFLQSALDGAFCIHIALVNCPEFDSTCSNFNFCRADGSVAEAEAHQKNQIHNKGLSTFGQVLVIELNSHLLS